MDERPVFVIGDVHGHFDRLEGLLRQEGIVGRCPDCDGSGITYNPDDDGGDCDACRGDGQRRVNHDVRVIQLGDLAHFGGTHGTPSGDRMCYEYASRYLDLVLWGNHDRAVFDPNSIFGGYEHPGDEVHAYMSRLIGDKKLTLAAEAHGHLIVHAGVHQRWQKLANEIGNAVEFAEYLNTMDRGYLSSLRNRDLTYQELRERQKRFAIIANISAIRGGPNPEGGVLWMDWDREKHLEGPFPYVCGHTAQTDGLAKTDEWGNWNIDIGGKTERRLCGLWLEIGRKPRHVKWNSAINLGEDYIR